MRLWQKHAARKSTLSCVGTEINCRIAGAGKNDICPKVTLELRYQDHKCRNAAHHHVLEESIRSFDLNVGPSGKVGRLLQKHVLRAKYLAYVDSHFLRACTSVNQTKT